MAKVPTTSHATPRAYRAFVSYRHSDNVNKERRWAEWVQHGLESYRIPPAIRGRENRVGTRVPETLFPIFRDEEELASGQELATVIDEALRSSDCLIVLCSPRSARSPWVEREVLRFQQLGKGDRILRVILEGEPDATARAVAGRDVDPSTECLPAPLRRSVDGSAAANLAVPLAVDLRREASTEQAYTTAGAFRAACEREDARLPENQRRSKRELRALEAREDKRLRRAFLKLVAGIIQVDLGQLTRRDAEARARRARNVALIALLVVVMVGALAVVAFVQSDRRQALLLAASGQELARARDAQGRGEWERALAHLERSLHFWRENSEAAGMLWHSLRHGPASRALVVDYLVEGLTEPQSPRFLGDGKWLVVRDGRDQVLILQTKSLVHRRIQLTATQQGATNIGLDGSERILIALEGSRWAIIDAQAATPRIVESTGGPPLAGASFSPTGRWVICGSEQSLRIVDVETGAIEQASETFGWGRTTINC